MKIYPSRNRWGSPKNHGLFGLFHGKSHRSKWMMIWGYLPTKTFAVRALESGRTYAARLDHGDLPIKEKR